MPAAPAAIGTFTSNESEGRTPETSPSIQWRTIRSRRFPLTAISLRFDPSGTAAEFLLLARPASLRGASQRLDTTHHGRLMGDGSCLLQKASSTIRTIAQCEVPYGL